MSTATLLSQPVERFTPNPASTIHEDAVKFNRKGLFVGGCPKSGTTMLLALIDGHPELAVLPEESHYFDWRKKYKSIRQMSGRLDFLLDNSELRRLNPAWVETEGEDRCIESHSYAGFDYSLFRNLAEEFAKQKWTDDSMLLSETIRAYAIAMDMDWRNCARWVEKTPANVPFADDVFEMFPESKMIQVVRDPRAVFASRKKRQLNKSGSYSKAHRLVREWNESCRQITRLKRHREQYLTVRYEDLVKDSRASLKQICQFIGIEFLPSMLLPTKAGKPWSGNSSFNWSFAGIDEHPLEHWRAELTREELWWIEAHCHEGMAIAGYPLETDAAFSLPRWAKPLPGESFAGYLRARKSSICQLAGLLKECHYKA